MTTKSEEYLQLFKQTETEADDFGRIIHVGRLKVSQQIRVSELTPGLDGETEMAGPNGEVMLIPRRGIPLLAAAVRQIDDFMVSFPRNRAELDGMMDLLGDVGIAAVLRATVRLNPQKSDDDEAESGDAMDQSKK